MIRVCFVCLGNICRSPTADGIMRHLVARASLDGHLHIDSAGTAGYHEGERADRRTLAAAKKRGVELPHLARQFLAGDFQRFDYVLAMDDSNHRDLVAIAPDPAAAAKVLLFRSFDPQSPRGAGVPDPYYGGPEGFDEVFDICMAGCQGLLAHLRREHGLP